MSISKVFSSLFIRGICKLLAPFVLFLPRFVVSFALFLHLSQVLLRIHKGVYPMAKPLRVTDRLTLCSIFLSLPLVVLVWTHFFVFYHRHCSLEELQKHGQSTPQWKLTVSLFASTRRTYSSTQPFSLVVSAVNFVSSISRYSLSPNELSIQCRTLLEGACSRNCFFSFSSSSSIYESD